MLQALYFCKPFREKVLEYKARNKRTKETLLTCLADLFHSIANQKKKTGTIAPKKFIARLRKENELFDNYMQQDAHEFLNYLLNTIADILQAEKQQLQQNSQANAKGNKSLIEVHRRVYFNRKSAYAACKRYPKLKNTRMQNKVYAKCDKYAQIAYQ